MKASFVSLLHTSARKAPTLLVLAAMAVVGYFGHTWGWKAPKLSAIWSRSAAPPKEDWCESHNVPDSRCIACHPELGGADVKDWCKEHGVPESQCTVCHPEILTKGVASDWCREHGLPESGCTLCHPEIAVKGEPPPRGAAATVSLEPGVKPATNPLTCQSHALRVQFASADALRKVGVQLEAVQERPMAASITAPGEITYDSTRLARVSSRLAGIVWRVEKEIGNPVRKGEVLALVDAAEVGRAKAEFLQGLSLLDLKEKTLKRIQTSTESGLRTRAELEEAEAALRDAKIRLLAAQQTLANLGLPNRHEPIRYDDLRSLPPDQLVDRMRLLGLPESLATTVEPATATANLLPLLSPLEGVVISREVVAGEVVEPGVSLFVVADPRRVWARIDVRLEDAPRIALGQPVQFRPDGIPDAVAAGTVSWISTAVDEKTRTVGVRADIENPEGRLLASTFGKARITIREAPNAIAVPSEAVHWEGCCHIVFVRLAGEIFQTRKVRLGAKGGGFTEILAGVLPGEVVVTAGSHVLKSEILKSRLGAGCCAE